MKHIKIYLTLAIVGFFTNNYTAGKYYISNIENIADLLDSYDVRYIVVGGLERETYGMPGMEKFSENLDAAFESNGVTIYRWQPQ